MEIGITSSIYKDEAGDYYAMIWNASNEQKTIDLFSVNGLISAKIVNGNSFIKVFLLNNLE